MRSLSLSGMTPRSLLYLRCTEDLIKCSNCQRNFFGLQIGDKSDSVSVDRLKPVFFSVTLVPAAPPLQGPPRLVPASVPRPPGPCLEPDLIPGSWLSSSKESEVFSGSSNVAPLEYSPDGLRFSASLHHPPTSPSGRSNLWLLQRRPSSASGLQTVRDLIGNALLLDIKLLVQYSIPTT